jgi:hypothetical protein
MEIECTFCMADVSDDQFGINLKLGSLSTFRGVDYSHELIPMPASLHCHMYQWPP